MKFSLLSIAVATLVSSAPSIVQAAPPDVKPSPSTPVQVMNNASSPVPVKILGDVPIVGDVEITNTSPIPVAVVSPTRPFAKLLCLSQIAGACDAFGNRPALPGSFVVPATTAGGEPVKRLVIEFASGTCVGLGRSTFVEIFGNPGAGSLTNPSTGDNFSSNRIPLSVAQFLQPPGVNGAQAFAQSAHMYFDPGTTVGISFDIVESGGIACRAQLNGHFVVQ
jgi:hypothetical protein